MKGEAGIGWIILNKRKKEKGDKMRNMGKGEGDR